MKKLKVKQLVDFRRKGKRGKKNFVAALKSIKVEENAGDGRDYWIRSWSTLSKAYRNDDSSLIKQKISELVVAEKSATSPIAKLLYNRNLEILRKYLNFDFSVWKPKGKLDFRRNSRISMIVKGLEIEVSPHQVFIFKRGRIEYIGGIWFVTQVNGFSSEEIGMFTEMLYRYLKNRWGKNMSLDPEFCITVDLTSGRVVKYSDIENQSVLRLLGTTLDEIKALL